VLRTRRRKENLIAQETNKSNYAGEAGTPCLLRVYFFQLILLFAKAKHISESDMSEESIASLEANVKRPRPASFKTETPKSV